ncbi:MAG: exodeoxyribonuclease III [Roseiflexaceae bacterium]
MSRRLTLVSWNVNGIRSVERRGFSGWMRELGADVIAVQETKAAPEQLAAGLRAPEGFHAAWCSAERRGYSGVATFSRTAPLEEARGLGDPRFDCEGRVLISHFPEFTFFNVYFPSGSSGPERVAYKLDFYRRFLEVIGGYLAEGRPLVVVGDVNTAYAEIDLARPRENRKTSGFLPEERAALGEFFAAGLVDSFRHHRPDTRRYSWWSGRSPDLRARDIGWRLDYILVSPDLRPHIADADILCDVTGSDHCPVSLTLEF